MQLFCQEKSPSNTISTWAFSIPIPQAKNRKMSWEGGEGKGQAYAWLCSLPSQKHETVLQSPKLVSAISQKSSFWPVMVPFFPLIEPLLCFLPFCLLKALCALDDQLVHFHQGTFSFLPFFSISMFGKHLKHLLMNGVHSVCLIHHVIESRNQTQGNADIRLHG